MGASECWPGGVDDGEEVVGLEGGAADEAAIDVFLVEEAFGVIGFHAAAVLDANAVGVVFVPHGGEGFADEGMDFLSLFVGGVSAGADGPDGFIGDDEAVGVVHLSVQLIELGADDVEGLVGVALFDFFADAVDEGEGGGIDGFGLAGDEGGGFADDV